MHGPTQEQAQRIQDTTPRRGPADSSDSLFALWQERSPSVARFPRCALSLRENESVVQIFPGRQLIESFELDDGHLFVVFDGGLYLGIRGCCF